VATDIIFCCGFCGSCLRVYPPVRTCNSGRARVSGMVLTYAARTGLDTVGDVLLTAHALVRAIAHHAHTPVRIRFAARLRFLAPHCPPNTPSLPYIRGCCRWLVRWAAWAFTTLPCLVSRADARLWCACYCAAAVDGTPYTHTGAGGTAIKSTRSNVNVFYHCLTRFSSSLSVASTFRFAAVLVFWNLRFKHSYVTRVVTDCGVSACWYRLYDMPLSNGIL